MPALVANVDDIEDIVKYDAITVQDRVEAKKYVVPRTRKTRTPDSKVKNVETEEKVQAESYIPGTMCKHCVCVIYTYIYIYIYIVEEGLDGHGFHALCDHCLMIA